MTPAKQNHDEEASRQSTETPPQNQHRNGRIVENNRDTGNSHAEDQRSQKLKEDASE